MKNTRLQFSEPKSGEYGHSVMVSETVTDKSTNNRSRRVVFVNLIDCPNGEDSEKWYAQERADVIDDYSGDTIVRLVSQKPIKGFKEVINPETKKSMGYYQKYEMQPFDGGNRGLVVDVTPTEATPEQVAIAQEQGSEAPF